MKILKRGQNSSPRLSFVLLDWSVRESFHLLHYLSLQSCRRKDFEVIVVEYYSRVSSALKPYQTEIDTWILLEMPPSCYYHKHLMYNAGMVLSRGDVVVFCDSDTMLKKTFVGAILAEFEKDPNIVLHLDQFRNVRREYYPFNFPSFEAVLGVGCSNNIGGKTKGILDVSDPLHERNYGACMCAKRKDLIAMGGADEHFDYLGHICGPYEMTFRLVNTGLREVWHDSEFMFHTWHPGQGGENNYLGPHDGRNLSTTAMEALVTGRVRPYVENAAIRMLRSSGDSNSELLLDNLIAVRNLHTWARDPQNGGTPVARVVSSPPKIEKYKGFRIEYSDRLYRARLVLDESIRNPEPLKMAVLEDASLEKIKRKIDLTTGGIVGFSSLVGSYYLLIWTLLVSTGRFASRIGRGLISLPREMLKLLVRLRSRIASFLTTLVVQRRAFPSVWDFLVWTYKTTAGVFWRTFQRSARALRIELKLIPVRLRRFLFRKDVATGSLTSLVVNLHYARQNRPPERKMERVIVVIQIPAVGYYLKLLSKLGLLPPVEVENPSGDQIKLWIQRMERDDSRELVMTADFYLKYHTFVSVLRLSKYVAIV